jgi:hypothetical protein
MGIIVGHDYTPDEHAGMISHDVSMKVLGVGDSMIMLYVDGDVRVFERSE